jgi:hypothetical protein
MRDPRTDPQAGDVLRLPSGVVALVDGADDTYVSASEAGGGWWSLDIADWRRAMADADALVSSDTAIAAAVERDEAIRDRDKAQKAAAEMEQGRNDAIRERHAYYVEAARLEGERDAAIRYRDHLRAQLNDMRRESNRLAAIIARSIAATGDPSGEGRRLVDLPAMVSVLRDEGATAMACLDAALRDRDAVRRVLLAIVERMEDDQEILNCLWRTITSPALGIGRLTDADLIAAMRKLCGVDGG